MFAACEILRLHQSLDACLHCGIQEIARVEKEAGRYSAADSVEAVCRLGACVKSRIAHYPAAITLVLNCNF